MVRWPSSPRFSSVGSLGGALFATTTSSVCASSDGGLAWRALLESLPQLVQSVSNTTRAPRPGEVDGRDYHFVEASRFDEMIAEGDLDDVALAGRGVLDAVAHDHRGGAVNLAVEDIRHNVGRFALTATGIGLLLMLVSLLARSRSPALAPVAARAPAQGPHLESSPSWPRP